jgi:hypothetical protein
VTHLCRVVDRGQRAIQRGQRLVLQLLAVHHRLLRVELPNVLGIVGLALAGEVALLVLGAHPRELGGRVRLPLLVVLQLGLERVALRGRNRAQLELVQIDQVLRLLHVGVDRVEFLCAHNTKTNFISQQQRIHRELESLFEGE